jgi:hypothetical protein
VTRIHPSVRGSEATLESFNGVTVGDTLSVRYCYQLATCKVLAIHPIPGTPNAWIVTDLLDYRMRDKLWRFVDGVRMRSGGPLDLTGMLREPLVPSTPRG